jgi:hypothetical protein
LPSSESSKSSNNTAYLVKNEKIDFMTTIPDVLDTEVHELNYTLKILDDKGYFTFWDENGDPNIYEIA